MAGPTHSNYPLSWSIKQEGTIIHWDQCAVRDVRRGDRLRLCTRLTGRWNRLWAKYNLGRWGIADQYHRISLVAIRIHQHRLASLLRRLARRILVATLGRAVGTGKYGGVDRPAHFPQHYPETGTALIFFMMQTISVVHALSSTRNHLFSSASASLTHKCTHGTVHLSNQPHGCFPSFIPSLTPSTVTPRLIEIESRSLSASFSHPRPRSTVLRTSCKNTGCKRQCSRDGIPSHRHYVTVICHQTGRA